MSYATAFVTWCHAQDVPLRAEAVFTPERVEAYTIGVLNGRPERSISVIRGALRTIGLACTKKAAWSRPPTKLRVNAYLAAPYTDTELAGLWAAAEAQATPRRRHVFRLILTAGLGAGLSSAEVFELRASDIVAHPADHRLRVIVLPDRFVPVRHAYATVLDELCQAVTQGRLVGGRASEAMLLKDPLAPFRRDLDIPKTLPALSLSRLRTTWAVATLSAPVTLAEFHAMAGTTSAKSIELYTQHIRTRDTAEWMRAAAGI